MSGVLAEDKKSTKMNDFVTSMSFATKTHNNRDFIIATVFSKGHCAASPLICYFVDCESNFCPQVQAMASPLGTGVLDHLLLLTTETSRVLEQALSDEDVQQLSTEAGCSQHSRGEKRKRATSDDGAPKLAWLQLHKDSLVDRTTQTQSLHL